MDHVTNLTRRDMALQRLEHHTCRILGIDWLPHCDARGYPGQELVTRAYLLRFSGGMPCLVVDASDQHWELITELGCFVDCQTIAEAVEHCPQDPIGAVPLQIQRLRNLLEPCVCLMKRFIEHFEAS